jgi:hypothetical protein
MRALLIFCILFTLIMNAVQCPGCKQSFDRGKALKAHQNRCTLLHIVAKERFRQREENVQKREAAKMETLQDQTMEDVAEEREEPRSDLAPVADQFIEGSSAVRKH